MIQQLKKRKLQKGIAIYLAMMILLETFQPGGAPPPAAAAPQVAHDGEDEDEAMDI